MLDDRSFSILYALLKGKKQTLIDLAINLKLSQRQITYCLVKINEWLEANEMSTIELTNGKLTQLTRETEQFIMANLTSRLDLGQNYYFNSRERQNALYLMLFVQQEYLSLNHFIVEFAVSRSTILSDIKHLRRRMSQKKLSLVYDRQNGYGIEGTEATIRYQMMEILMETLNEENGTHVLNRVIKSNRLLTIAQIEKIILVKITKWQIEIIEKKLNEFMYMLVFLIPRLKFDTGFKTETDLLALFKDTKEFNFSQELLSSLKQKSAVNSCYLTGWLLGISVGNISEATADRPLIINLVDKMIYRFEAVAGTKFSNKQRIREQIYQHLRPTYYRLLFKLPIVNPLTQKIQAEYKEFYQIVKTIMKPFNSLFEEQIPEGELALLTLHFASFFFNEEDQLIKKKTAIVVCPHGIGSSVILNKELQSLLPELEFLEGVTHQNLKTIPLDIDLIFSTTPSMELLQLTKPYIVVSPIMTSREKYQVIQEVYLKLGEEPLVEHNITKVMSIVRKHLPPAISDNIEREIYATVLQPHLKNMSEGDGPLLSEIINEKLIQLNVEANHWEEAIRKAAQPLIDNDMVLPSYVEDMINTTKEVGPYIVITKHVALPHARPELGAKKIAISIATLKQPIEFGNKDNDPVKYLFCLSAKDSSTHLNAMAELVELLERSDFYDILDHARTAKDIYQYILDYEKEMQR